jgi:Cu/Ag efflux protein CusF
MKAPALLFTMWLFCVGFFACRSVPEQRYELKGIVVSVDHGHQQATIAHEEIPGYMGAMTMPFSLKEKWAFGVLSPGSKVHADPGCGG